MTTPPLSPTLAEGLKQTYAAYLKAAPAVDAHGNKLSRRQRKRRKEQLAEAGWIEGKGRRYGE